MTYYSEKLRGYIDIDALYDALQEGRILSNGFNGCFLYKKENCICYNCNGSSAQKNTKEGLKFIIKLLDRSYDLTTFEVGYGLYVNMI